MENIKIKGMSCQHCVGSVRKALEDLPELSDIKVELDKGEATFVNDGVDRSAIRNAIQKIGFEPLD